MVNEQKKEQQKKQQKKKQASGAGVWSGPDALIGRDEIIDADDTFDGAGPTEIAADVVKGAPAKL